MRVSEKNIVGTSRMVCGAESMKGTVSARPSVCLSHAPDAAVWGHQW